MKMKVKMRIFKCFSCDRHYRLKDVSSLFREVSEVLLRGLSESSVNGTREDSWC